MLLVKQKSNEQSKKNLPTAPRDVNNVSWGPFFVLPGVVICSVIVWLYVRLLWGFLFLPGSSSLVLPWYVQPS